MAKIRIGLVGSGSIAPFHFNSFIKNEDAQVLGMCTRQGGNLEKLKRMCQEWNIQAYRDFDELVEDPQIDALEIGSVNTEHFSQIMKAIALGKPVLAEKPVVTDFGLLDQIIQASQQKGVLVFPAHNFVYRGAVQQAKQLIESGQLGRVTYASFISTHTLPAEHIRGWRGQLDQSSGGALMDSGHHQVYLSLYMMGMPQKIQAFRARRVLGEMQGEDIAQINAFYPDQAIGTIMQSWTSGYGDGLNGIKIIGPKGGLQVTDALYFNGEQLNEDASYAGSFVNQARAFTDAILHGRPPLSTLEDTCRTLKIIYGAYESSEQDKVIVF
ncbi:MAG TPA: Gfo/Idh/MocA family oxidoreductase [Anaerolineaceae bacterium]|nr:Gfo/Idh/MocA family oxidoreductase [Anaerolineaceae bacterium]